MDKRERHVPNYEQPIYGAQILEPEQCKSCMFRDKTKVTIDGRTREVGWCKDNCIVFPYPESKPDEVMYNTGDCELYEKE